MDRMYQIVLLSYFVLVAFVLIADGDANSDRSYRVKRYLSFGNISHFFGTTEVEWANTNIDIEILIFLKHYAYCQRAMERAMLGVSLRDRIRNEAIRSRTKYRLNFKANMVPWNQIFAYALGFRINWDEPPDSFHPYHHLQRRTVYEGMETVMDRNGLKGYHCVRRAICEMQMIPKPAGVYYKILKMVFRKQSSATDKWHNVTEEDCQLSISMCPFSLLEVSPYTDL